jgi:hypothetical protein
MQGASPAGSVPALDHDRMFKELLTTFFVEFLDLFFPKLAVPLDRGSLEFLSQEHFTNLFAGEEYRADLVVKARFKGAARFFLIHVEHQSTAPANFGERFFRYYCAIFEKHGVPVYPIVVYSHDTPRKKQPDVYRIGFPDGEVLRFHYRVVQLNRLSWRRFTKARNPVASALMSKMKIAPRDRPRVKLECLRLMVTLKLDRARMKLIASFIDAYLTLSKAEEERFARSLERSDLQPKQREEIVEYVTSWEQRGLEKGLQQGLEQGLERGTEALRQVLLEILASRFGDLHGETVARIQAIRSLDELERLTHRALTVASVADLGLPQAEPVPAATRPAPRRPARNRKAKP